MVTSFTDEDGKTTSFTYNDPNYWRVKAVTDPTGATTDISYGTNPPSVESTLNFNGNTSTVDVYTQLYGLGRVYLTQRRQGQTSGNYDSVMTTYDALGRPS